MMKTNLRLIEQRRAKGISVRQRKVSQSIIGQPGKAGRRLAAEVWWRQRLVLRAVSIKETTCESAFRGVQVVHVDNELIFIELGRYAECRESTKRKRLRRIDSLRRGNYILAVRQLKV